MCGRCPGRQVAGAHRLQQRRNRLGLRANAIQCNQCRIAQQLVTVLQGPYQLRHGRLGLGPDEAQRHRGCSAQVKIVVPVSEHTRQARYGCDSEAAVFPELAGRGQARGLRTRLQLLNKAGYAGLAARS